MSQTADRERHSREFWIAVALAVLLVVGAFGWALRHMQPAPPRHLVMATGAPGGAYDQMGRAFARALAHEGIELELRATGGSVDNLQLLRAPDSGVALALVQGGVVHSKADSGSQPALAGEPATSQSPGRPSSLSDDDLTGLASLYKEPLWVFYRGSRTLERLSDLRGLRVSVGPPGSGTQLLARELLAANGLEPAALKLQELTTDDAAAALLAGEIDAAMMVSSPRAPLIDRLIRAEGVRLMTFPQAEAYTRRFPYLVKMTLPAGSYDLAANRPSQDLMLIGPTANLLARADLHPAVVTLLMRTAVQLGREPSPLHEPSSFPSEQGLDIPINHDAKRFLTAGPPFLARHLPFWVAVWIERAVVLLVPFIAVVLPLLRFAPALYAWRVKSRIYRWYGRLKRLDAELDLAGSRLDLGAVQRELDAIDHGVSHLHTPLAFSEHLYNLRIHIELVRRRLRQRAAEATRRAAEAAGTAKQPDSASL